VSHSPRETRGKYPEIAVGTHLAASCGTAMKLTYADIAARDVRLTSAEAAALVLAAARALESAGARGVPPAERILLNSDGRVVLEDVSDAAGDETVRVRCLGELLEQLLGLHRDAAQAPGRAGVPGPLLLMLARATGAIDAPRPSYTEFRRALARFATPGDTALASLFWRCVTPDRHALTTTVAPAVLPWRAPVQAAEPVRVVPIRDRRRPRPRAAEFQRALKRSKRRRLLHRAALVTGAVGCLGAGAIGGWIVALTEVPPQKPAEVRSEIPRPVIIELKEPAAVPPSAPRPPRATAVSAAPLVLASVVGDNAFSPSFGHQGRSVLFHAGRERGALMRASIGEAGAVQVATVLRDGSANYHASLSPDGKWLAYDSDRDGIRNVYVARADATAPRRVSGEGYAAVPSWSPDGRRLTFIKADQRRARVWNVWVADLQSGRLSQVSHHRTGQAWRAPWFPDGERIAYSVEDRLVIANVHTGTSRAYRSPRRGRLVRTPAVSPDGRSIVFQVHGDGAWVLDVPTGEMRRVLADPSAEEFAWSPDGKQVAYHTRRGRTWSVWQASLR
jgi:hypothetical protein